MKKPSSRKLKPVCMDHLLMDATVMGERGQVVIPKSIREQLKLAPGTRLMVMHPKDGPIMLFPVEQMRQHLDLMSKNMMSLLDNAS